MKKALSLHIGLNHIDPAAYGNDGELANCINDCNAMFDIATANGFQAVKLHDSEATCPRVTAEISKAASELESGDYFLVSYAGHGSQVPDEDSEELDGMNETWVLYDRQMIDNELYRLWETFKDGVKIFVLSDSCHSGTMMRPFLMQVQPQLRNLSPLSRKFRTPLVKGKRSVKAATPDEIVNDIRTMTMIDGKYNTGKGRDRSSQNLKRLLPVGNSLENYVMNRDLYRTVSLLAGEKRDADIKARLIYISGCQDNQTSGDGPEGTNGIFTGNVLKVWNKGSFTGCYPDFYSRVCGFMPADQSPNYMKLGTDHSEFENEKPFTLKKSSSTPSVPVTTGLTQPSITVSSKWSRTGEAPLLRINKGGNPLCYVELATDKTLFNRKENGDRRNANNFYASYKDSTLNSFLLSDDEFRIPAATWELLKNASQIFYRVGAASDEKWTNFKVSFSDAQFDQAPSFEVVSETVAPVPEPSGQPTEHSYSLNDSVGENGTNKKEDVKTIQSLLNKVPSNEGGPEIKLVVDGLYGKKTLNAIMGFQMYWGYDNEEEYKIIEPESNTFNELVSQASRSVTAQPVIKDKSQLEEAYN